MMIRQLVIVNNENVYENNGNFFCDNIDLKSISEGLNKTFKILLIARKTSTERSHQINLEAINAVSNIFKCLLSLINTFQNKETQYLLISVTPFTFIAYLLLFIFRRKVFFYLRSNGYEEYKSIFGFFGPFLYHIMFVIISWKANLVSCRSHLLKGRKGKVVSPSQLNENWFTLRLESDLTKVKLLYVGRIKVEKGIFSLLELIKNRETDFALSIVGTNKKNHNIINQNNVSIIDFVNRNDSIIKIYDSHNIFILPSFTEGHPQVLDESLSRLRPVIIFEEISHVVGNRKGVFVSKRDFASLSKTISYIMDNYHSIQKEMTQNVLPTKKDFIKQMSFIIQGK